MTTRENLKTETFHPLIIAHFIEEEEGKRGMLHKSENAVIN